LESWIIDTVLGLGAVGIGVLMLLENVFPPLPSELIMPLGGYLSARGRMSFWSTVAAGTLGSLLGAVLWYGVGRRVTRERLRGWVEAHGVWLAMTPGDVDRASRWFGEHGGKAVLIGRLVPVVRTLISVPAGFSRMPFLPFLLYSAVGTALWTGALTYAGRLLGSQFQQVDRYLGWVAWAVIAASAVAYVYRVVQIRRQHG
jgi:membrane protein DedA with SNARE-associated domain